MEVTPNHYIQLPMYSDVCYIQDVAEQTVETTPLKDMKMKPLPPTRLEIFCGETKVECSQECEADRSKQQKGVGINIRLKTGRFINKTESSVWSKLKPETKADIETVLREEYDRFRHVDDTPAVGGSFQQLLQLIEQCFKDNRLDMVNRIDVKEMRKLVPQLRKLCYLDPSEIENKGKVKNIWSKRPDDWPVDVLHVDPNNPGTNTYTNKRNPKPNKQQLEKMFCWLMEKYQARRDELHALLSPTSNVTPGGFDDDEHGHMFLNIINGLNDGSVSDACTKLYAKLWREDTNGMEHLFLQIEAQQTATTILKQTLVRFENNVPVDLPDFVDKLNRCYDEYQAKCFNLERSPQTQISSTLTVDVPCSPQTPGTFNSLVAPSFDIKHEKKTGQVNTILLDPSSPQQALYTTDAKETNVAFTLEGLDIDTLNDDYLTELILNGQVFNPNQGMDFDAGDQDPLRANPMLSDAGTFGAYQESQAFPQTPQMIPSFVSEEAMDM